MKTLRYMVMAVVLFAISGVAHAFTVTMQDPDSSDLPFFLIQPGQPFSFGFADFPGGSFTFEGVTYLGWAVGFNDSDQVLTNIDLGFGSNSALNAANPTGANPTCTSNAFDHLDCVYNQETGQYSLSFVDAGGINPYSFVFIFENAVDGSNFPDVDGVANVPEPSSMWLALSGLGSAGYLIRRRRKGLTV